MSTSTSEILNAFSNGSGISAGTLAIVAGIGIFVLIVGITITVLFRRLSMFQKDDNTHGVLKDATTAMLALFIVVLIVAALANW